MGTRAAVLLVDLEGTLDRHWFGREPVLHDPVPALEPTVKRKVHDLGSTWRAERWTEPERIIDPSAAAALLPHHQNGALVFMTERPEDLRLVTARRLATAGFTGVPLHHVALGEHPAYGKRRIARAVRPTLTIEDDLRIAEFLARFGYETLLVDDRYNQGPIGSINLMRISRFDIAKVVALRLVPELPDAEPEMVLEGALAHP